MLFWLAPHIKYKWLHYIENLDAFSCVIWNVRILILVLLKINCKHDALEFFRLFKIRNISIVFLCVCVFWSISLPFDYWDELGIALRCESFFCFWIWIYWLLWVFITEMNKKEVIIMQLHPISAALSIYFIFVSLFLCLPPSLSMYLSTPLNLSHSFFHFISLSRFPSFFYLYILRINWFNRILL